MAKAVIQASILGGAALAVLPNAAIEIRDENTGSLVSLWSDRDGVTTTLNPTTSDVNGFFRVYADPGRYRITATLGALTREWRDVIIESLAISATDAENVKETLELYTQDDAAKGAGPLGLYDGVAPAFLKTVSDMLQMEPVSLFRFIDRARHAGIKARTDLNGTEAGWQLAIDAMEDVGGGLITVPWGSFHLDAASVDLKPSVYIDGFGQYATEVVAEGDFAVFQALGSSGAGVVNRGGVSRMLIRGGGKANANAHGINLAWVNRMDFHNLRFHACRRAFAFSNVWQAKLDTLHADGSGADQNYIGFYGAEVDPSNQNNAVQMVNCMAQGVELYGFRLINFNGSKFVNCEAADGVHAWYLGDPTTGTERVRWGHFVNCLGDTTSSDIWRLEKGAALAFEDVQFSACWAGNSTGGHGWNISGVSKCQFGTPLVKSVNKSAMRFYQSSRCVLSGAQLTEYDGAAGGNPGIALADSQIISIGGGGHVYTSVPGALSVVESGTADHNTVTGVHLHGGVTKVGANSKFARNTGTKCENRGSAQITAGSTSVTVTHGIGYTPSIDDVQLNCRDNLGAATQVYAENMTATTFVIRTDADPGATVTISWSIDPSIA